MFAIAKEWCFLVKYGHICPMNRWWKGSRIGYGIVRCCEAISNAVGPSGSDEILLEVKTWKYRKYDTRHTRTPIGVTLKDGRTQNPENTCINVLNRLSHQFCLTSIRNQWIIRQSEWKYKNPRNPGKTARGIRTPISVTMENGMAASTREAHHYVNNRSSNA